jgi:alkyl hydroperoxide reductase subunit AhpC
MLFTMPKDYVFVCTCRDCRQITFRLLPNGKATCEICGATYSYCKTTSEWVREIKRSKRTKKKLENMNNDNNPYDTKQS